MRFGLLLSSLTRCSSQKPISRKRVDISGDAESCLMVTDSPACTSLSLQSGAPDAFSCVEIGSPTGHKIRSLETQLQGTKFNASPLGRGQPCPRELNRQN